MRRRKTDRQTERGGGGGGGWRQGRGVCVGERQRQR